MNLLQVGTREPEEVGVEFVALEVFQLRSILQHAIQPLLIVSMIVSHIKVTQGGTTNGHGTIVRHILHFDGVQTRRGAGREGNFLESHVNQVHFFQQWHMEIQRRSVAVAVIVKSALGFGNRENPNLCRIHSLQIVLKRGWREGDGYNVLGDAALICFLQGLGSMRSLKAPAARGRVVGPMGGRIEAAWAMRRGYLVEGTLAGAAVEHQHHAIRSVGGPSIFHAMCGMRDPTRSAIGRINHLGASGAGLSWSEASLLVILPVSLLAFSAAVGCAMASRTVVPGCCTTHDARMVLFPLLPALVVLARWHLFNGKNLVIRCAVNELVERPLYRCYV